MKWIGQHIYDLVSRFRDSVYLEDLTTTTETNVLVVDSAGLVSKSTSVAGDLTSIEAGTGLSGTSLTGPIPTLNVDAAQTQITSIGTIGTGVWNGTAITKPYINADQRNITQIGTIETGVWNATAINQTYLVGQSGINTGDETVDRINALDITEVGTIDSGVWQGTTIKTAYIGDDQVTEDKLADTLLAEIDANTAKATNVTTDLTATTHASQITINSSDGDNVIIAEASGSIAGVMAVAHHGKLDGIEAGATTDQSKSDIDGLAITTVGTVDTGVWNGTKITDIYTNSSGKRYGSTIKILPSDFMINEDAASPLSFKDGANSGVHVNDTSSEAIAFITIPEGMKATLVDIYGTHDKTIKVWELDLNASFNFTASTIGTGAMNTQLDITDTDATATNYLAIQVTLTATTQRVWGGIVTIAPQ